MSQLTKPLPQRDMVALFDIVVVVLGDLVGGQLPPDLTDHVRRRLAKDGLIARDASVGEVGALVADLVQRMRYALGEYPALPQPSPRRTIHHLSVPSRDAAHACREALIGFGATSVTVHDEDGQAWQVRASFPDLPPDPSHRARQAELAALATRHGGHYEGSSN